MPSGLGMKPHLRRYRNGCWECRYFKWIGFGRTPESAWTRMWGRYGIWMLHEAARKVRNMGQG